MRHKIYSSLEVNFFQVLFTPKNTTQPAIITPVQTMVVANQPELSAMAAKT